MILRYDHTVFLKIKKIKMYEKIVNKCVKFGHNTFENITIFLPGN